MYILQAICNCDWDVWFSITLHWSTYGYGSGGEGTSLQIFFFSQKLNHHIYIYIDHLAWDELFALKWQRGFSRQIVIVELISLSWQLKLLDGWTMGIYAINAP